MSERVASGSIAPRVEVVVMPRSGAPTVAIRALARAGARDEARAGLAWCAGRALTEGTAARSWDQLAAEVEGRGASCQSVGGPESIGVAVDALAEDWRLALEWALDCLLFPVVPSDRLELVRLHAVSELQAQLDQPELRAGWTFRRQLYGERHPRGRPLQGTESDVASIDRSAVAAFHRQALASGLLVVAVGDLEGAELEARVRELVGRVEPLDRSDLEHVEPEPGEARARIELPGADQATLLLGHLTVPRLHPDRRALDVASVVLGAGSGLSGRIPQRIREDEGLAYVAQATMVAGGGLDRGRLQVHVGTAEENLERAELAAREELTRFAADGPTEVEVDDARAFILGQETLRRETARQRAAIAADGAFYGFDSSLEAVRTELAALDRETVAAAVRRHLHPERLQVTHGVPAAL